MKVDIDFEGLYNLSSTLDLNAIFIRSYKNILETVEKKIKDRNSKSVFEKLKTTHNITQSDIITVCYIIFYKKI